MDSELRSGQLRWVSDQIVFDDDHYTLVVRFKICWCDGDVTRIMTFKSEKEALDCLYDMLHANVFDRLIGGNVCVRCGEQSIDVGARPYMMICSRCLGDGRDPS